MRIVQADAFTSEPFSGNPAAVCVTPGPQPESWMQQVAAEMNLSETAFVHRAGGAFALRWFTPTVEVDLCGHATLASAHVLWEEGIVDAAEVIGFDTRSGRLSARYAGEWIELDFPAREAVPSDAPDGLAAALRCDPVSVARSDTGFLVELSGEEEVRKAGPDFDALARLPSSVIITAPGSDFDFVSRYFAPGYGIDEDPVTGSAHCTLGPFWAARLGRTELTGFQASARGGVVRVRVDGDRVQLGGQAVTVLRGELATEPPTSAAP